MTARTAFTYRDYAALPDDGKRYEIHDGKLCEMTAPSSWHQIASANLGDVLRAHVKARNLGLVLYAPLDVILSDTTEATTILQPDLVLLPRRRPGYRARTRSESSRTTTASPRSGRSWTRRFRSTIRISSRSGPPRTLGEPATKKLMWENAAKFSRLTSTPWS